MPQYKKHIFICENLRPADSPKGSCARRGGVELKSVLKKKMAAKGLHKTYRINSAGCLGACEHGASMVIYPDGVWYGHVTADDLDEIIGTSILDDKIIHRLEIKEPKDA